MAAPEPLTALSAPEDPASASCLGCGTCCSPTISGSSCVEDGCLNSECVCNAKDPAYCNRPTENGPCDASPGHEGKCWGGVRDVF